MEILLIEPFYTGSHKQWCDSLKQFSSHNIELLTMSGHHWKWRMHGGAITLAKKFFEIDFKPDLIICSDMLDLSSFLSLTKNKTKDIPAVIYFHENQLTYPWSTYDRDVKLNRDNHYAFINFISALVADRVFFNSNYHMNSFLQALPNFLKGFPDHNELSRIELIKAKSSVLHLGLDLKRFDKHKSRIKNDLPVILWNHRWEHDKNPDDFFDVLTLLKKENIDFNLVVLGKNYSKNPEVFNRAETEFDDNIIHFGYVDTYDEYAKWLWQSDILPVTSNQDYFGASVVEAIYCGVYPLLPNRLAYSEHLNEKLWNRCVYNSNEELYTKLKDVIISKTFKDWQCGNSAIKYDWRIMIEAYDKQFENILQFS